MNQGGIETYVLRFLEYYKSIDTIEVTVLVRNYETGVYHSSYSALGVDIFFQPLGYFDLLKFYRFYKLMRRGRFDVVCDFNANFAGIPMFFAWLLGVEKRISFYRQGKNHFATSMLKKTYNYCANRLVRDFSTDILSNSASALDFFFPTRSGDKRFHIINNGFDLSHYKVSKRDIRSELDIPTKAKIITHVGRLDPLKNQKSVLTVAHELIKERDDVFFLFCGEGTEELESQCKMLAIENNIRILGYRKDVPDILLTSDVFYFPSLSEGQPNALIEAVLAGLSIVASDIPSIVELIPKKYSHLLVNPLDTKGALTLIKTHLTRTDFKTNNTLKQNFQRRFDQTITFNEFYQLLLK